jgi:type III restriction enzyme
MLQLQFDANQDYQLEAVAGVIDLFAGWNRHADATLFSSEVIANLPPYENFDEGWLFENLRQVQERHKLAVEELQFALTMDDGSLLDGVVLDGHRYPHFTLEMETGTGKTYVYLRTIYELHQRYGFGKFIIVVPSIAIYEGVVKNFAITRAHFRSLYGNATVNLIQYDGSQLARLRAFAASTFCEVLVMTLDAFNKASNNLYKPSEKLPGERLPYQYLQETRPILILDEPQNMESERAKQALRTLKPLLALRYSATHRTSPNLLYRLTPFDAYRRNLVKKIQVLGVTEQENLNLPLLDLERIERGDRITATIKTNALVDGKLKPVTLTLRQGDDLAVKSKRSDYVGYVVSEINLADGAVHFANGVVLRTSDVAGTARSEIFRVQIEQTIEQHMRMQNDLLSKGVKVLSLFFIDRVANYTAADGLIRRLFDEAFAKYQGTCSHFANREAHQVREAYFAKSKKKDGSEEAIDTESRTVQEREAEKRAFALIMRDKEKLLSLSEPVAFIFAHSALKEGWDNPNVFQICTLNQSQSELKKRQEIGRGLRLCVNQQGERLHSEEVNVLTVVANESYRSYAEGLQQEYVADGVVAPPLATPARKNVALRNDRIYHENPHFRRFWEALSQRVSYRLHVDTPQLIEDAVLRLNQKHFPNPIITVERGNIQLAEEWSIKVETINPEKGFAKLTVSLINEFGEEDTPQYTLKAGEEVAAEFDEVRLKKLGNFRIERIDGDWRVIFANDVKLRAGESWRFTPPAAKHIAERASLAPRQRYPVINLLDRAAHELSLTRPTINQIFKRMRPDKQTMLLRNPEGFAGVFLDVLRDALADHVAERLEFVVEPGWALFGAEDLEKFFPVRREYPQREVVEAGARGLYDRMQKDSEIERSFIEKLRDDLFVEFYFKFPAGFRVPLPRIIGNYNPDWGIARLDETGQPVIYKVRETKGSANIEQLQFGHEKRKIRCAQQYFAAIGIDYRTITGRELDWWKPDGAVALKLGI